MGGNMNKAITMEIYTSRLDVKEGEFVVLFGIQGVGKSYTLNKIKRDYPDKVCFLLRSERTAIRHRVEIVSAITRPYKIFLFDEPTDHNLDREDRMELLALIKTLHDQGNTIIMATHDFAAVELGTRIIELFPDKSFIEHGQGLHHLL